MIEAAMFVALGFFSATLISLMILPAIARRADRLARRRAEAAFPLSLDQVAADRDHLRAELAVRERGYERKMEEALSQRAEALDATGRKDGEIAALNRDLDGKRNDIAGLDGKLAAMTQDRNATQSRLEAESARHVATQGEKATALAEGQRLTGLLHERNEEIGALHRVREGLEQDLAGSRAETAGLEARGKALQKDIKALEQERTHLSALLKDEQGKVAMAMGQMANLERELGAVHAEKTSIGAQAGTLVDELAAMDTQRGALAAALDAEKARLAEAVQERARIEQGFMARGTELDAERGMTMLRTTERDAARSETGESRRRIDDLHRSLEEGERRLKRLQTELLRDQTMLGEKLRRAEERAEAALVAHRSSDQSILQLRVERSVLKEDVSRLKREASAMKANILTENMALRREITALASAMLKQRGPAQILPSQKLASEPRKPQRVQRLPQESGIQPTSETSTVSHE